MSEAKPTPTEHAKAHPGLKLMTEREQIIMALAKASDKARWAYLFSLNQWKEIK